MGPSSNSFEGGTRELLKTVVLSSSFSADESNGGDDTSRARATAEALNNGSSVPVSHSSSVIRIDNPLPRSRPNGHPQHHPHCRRLPAAKNDNVKSILAKPIKLADQMIRAADYAHTFPTECADLKSKTECLAALLRQAARTEFYGLLTRLIMDDTEQVLDKVLILIDKCKEDG